MDLAGGSLVFLGVVVALVLAVGSGPYARRGDIGARRDRLGTVEVGKDVTADVRTWGRGSDASAQRRRRATPVEQRTAEALGVAPVRARASQGLDLERFAADLADPALRERVEEDLRSGLAGGVNGTPTFFLDGVRYDDDVDEDELGGAIARAGDATVEVR